MPAAAPWRQVAPPQLTNRSSTFRPYGPPPDAAKAAPLSSDVRHSAMKIYWSLKSIPELKNVSFGERIRRWQRAYSYSLRHMITWLAILLYGLCIALGGLCGQQLGSVFVGLFLGVAVGELVCNPLKIAVVRRRYRHVLLEDSLAASGIRNA